MTEYDDYVQSTVNEVYQKLKTGPEGLESEETIRRLKEHGPNTIPLTKKLSLTSRTILQLKNAFNLLLLLATTLSLFSGYAYRDTGSIQMGWAIAAVVAINVAFSIFQEYRAEQAVQSIAKMIPTKAKALRGGTQVEVEVSEIVPGDIIILEEGDRVPADVRLIKAFEISVNNSILTGESDPQRRFVNMTPGMTANTISEYQNLMFAGATVVSGFARGVVIYTGKDTQFGRIVALSGESEDPLSPLQKDIDSTARINLILSLVVGTFFFLVAKTFVNLTIVESILFAIGVMVSLVPEGFQLTVSLSLAITALAMSKRNVVVKRLSSIETIGSMTVLCVDKTGTVTSGEMMVEKLWANGKIYDVTGDGYKPDGLITLDEMKPSLDESPQVLRMLEVSAFCTNAKLVAPSDSIGRWSILGDATDGAFLVLAGKGDFNTEQALFERPRVELLPFDSHRRMMTVIHRDDSGLETAYSKGSCYEVLQKSTKVFHNDLVEQLNDELRDRIKSQITDFASEGFRVLAMAFRSLPERTQPTADEVEKEMTFLGLAALHDPPRPNVAAAVHQAREAGIWVIMITGDHELTAEAIAKKVGILTKPDPRVVTGSDLNNMSDNELTEALNRKEIIFARTTPEHKLRIVKALMARGETVAVTGDGVNDSPALIEANVGVAMGAGGTDVARESADIVLLDNDFTSIVEAVRLGRATYDNLRKFVYYVYTHNFAELFTFVSFIILGIPLPLLVVQVLAIDLILEIPVSLALIVEPPELDVMRRQPRSSGVKLMAFDSLARAAFVGLFFGGVGTVAASLIWSRSGWVLGDRVVVDPIIYASGTAAVMITIMFGQLGNLLSVRSGLYSIGSFNLLKNKWIIVGILVEFVMLVMMIYSPFLQPVFGTAALSPIDFLLLLAFAPIAFLVIELSKRAFGRFGK
jgi:Ca2+-transporting ATPase